MCRLGHTGANSLETRHNWLLTIIARPLFSFKALKHSRHSATWQTLCRRPHYGKKKNLQRLPTSRRKSEEDCSSRSLAGMRGTLAISGSEAQRSFSDWARSAAGLKFLDAGGQACTARYSSPLWCCFFAPCSPALTALREHEASTQHVWTKEQKQKLWY